MKEKDAQRSEIDDMEPAVFDSLLHFVHIDSLSDDADKNGEIRKKNLGEIIIKILNKKGLKNKNSPNIHRKLPLPRAKETGATTGPLSFISTAAPMHTDGDGERRRNKEWRAGMVGR